MLDLHLIDNRAVVVVAAVAVVVAVCLFYWLILFGFHRLLLAWQMFSEILLRASYPIKQISP